MREKAKAAIKHFYHNELWPDVPNQLHFANMVMRYVAELLEGLFLKGPPDALVQDSKSMGVGCSHSLQGKANNFGHPALKSLVQEFLYSPAGDHCLSTCYPQVFETVPGKAIALVATAVSHSHITVAEVDYESDCQLP